MKKMIFTCLRDQNIIFRKLMTEFLGEIVTKKLSKKAFQDNFCNELLDLLVDSDIQVRLEAMDVAV
jgi:hypothetical protein